MNTSVQTDTRPSLMGSLLKDKSLKRKSPLVDGAYYSEALATLQSLPKWVNLVWAPLKDELENTPLSERSKSILYQKLEQACEEEELDWKRFLFIKIACQHRPHMIQHEEATVLLFKLMGVQNQNKLMPYALHNYLYSKALVRDEKSADAITLFIWLLEYVQGGKDSSHLFPVLQNTYQKVESLLEENRGAPRIRHFMALWNKTSDGGSEDDCDESGEEAESPSQKRRCIKAEE
ncbi:hypothetical protein V8C34DRAFT_312830 [Trichoderma compactum]